MHLKAHVSLLALLTSSSTPNPLKFPGCSRLQLTSHSIRHGVSPLHILILLIFCYSSLTESPGHVQSVFSYWSGILQMPLDILSLIHNKNLSPDHEVAILVVTLLCPCLDSWLALLCISAWLLCVSHKINSLIYVFILFRSKIWESQGIQIKSTKNSSSSWLTVKFYSKRTKF